MGLFCFVIFFPIFSLFIIRTIIVILLKNLFNNFFLFVAVLYSGQKININYLSQNITVDYFYFLQIIINCIFIPEDFIKFIIFNCVLIYLCRRILLVYPPHLLWFFWIYPKNINLYSILTFCHNIKCLLFNFYFVNYINRRIFGQHPVFFLSLLIHSLFCHIIIWIFNLFIGTYYVIILFVTNYSPIIILFLFSIPLNFILFFQFLTDIISFYFYVILIVVLILFIFRPFLLSFFVF